MRERYRTQVREQILDSAETQIAQSGPASLSLRAVARELGMAPSAIHRYFTSRDDVLTALMVREFDALGEAIDAAEIAVQPRDDYRNRIRAVFGAQREWALANPQSWALLFGSPVPGYVEPHEVCDAANRFVDVVVRIVAELLASGRTVEKPPTAMIPRPGSLVPAAGLGGAIPDWQIAAGVAAYAWMCGAITAELRGTFVDFVADNEAIYFSEVDHWITELGL